MQNLEYQEHLWQIKKKFKKKFKITEGDHFNHKIVHLCLIFFENFVWDALNSKEARKRFWNSLQIEGSFTVRKPQGLALACPCFYLKTYLLEHRSKKLFLKETLLGIHI